MTKIRLVARDMITMPFDRVNDAPVVRAPELFTNADGVEFVEFYTGSDDPADLAYCRIMIRADIPIDLEVDLRPENFA